MLLSFPPNIKQAAEALWLPETTKVEEFRLAKHKSIPNQKVYMCRSGGRVFVKMFLWRPKQMSTQSILTTETWGN